MDVHFFRGLIESALSAKRKWNHESCSFAGDYDSHWWHNNPVLDWGTAVKLSRVSKGCMELFEAFKTKLMTATMEYMYYERAKSGDLSNEEHTLHVGPFTLEFDAFDTNKLVISHDERAFRIITRSLGQSESILSSNTYNITLNRRHKVRTMGGDEITNIRVFSKEFLELFDVYDFLKEHGFPDDVAVPDPTCKEEKILRDVQRKRNEEWKKKMDEERKLVKKRIVKMVKRGSNWVTIKTENSTIYRQR